MMKKIMINLAVCIALFTNLTAQALDYVNEIVLLDGSHIRYCRMQDGSINYCTEEDALNAKRAKARPELLPEHERPANAITPNVIIQGVGTTASNISNTIYDIRSIWNAFGKCW